MGNLANFLVLAAKGSDVKMLEAVREDLVELYTTLKKPELAAQYRGPPKGSVS